MLQEVNLTKKVLAYEIVTIRGARGGEDPPLIVSIPKDVARAAKMKKNDKMRMYTDGEIVYINRLEEPKL